MSLITIPYVFQPGTTAASAQVNADFNAIVNVVNGLLDSTNISTITTSQVLAAKGQVSFIGGFIMQWSNGADNVPVDNSTAATPTFKISFPNACFGVWGGILLNSLTNAWQLSPVYIDPGSISLTGFSCTISGGPSGQTAPIFWVAIGY